MIDSHQCGDRERKAVEKHPTSMMSVAAMLNPVEDQNLLRPISPAESVDIITKQTPVPKKLKLAKDAPIFSEGKPTGRVKFPPYESFNEIDREEISKLNIYPALGAITAYPRHIPYSSDKKLFQQKTGREAFEVFQYTFKLPNDEKIHTVMWDYNVGLVRITPFFKCGQYAKTVPGKMLAANPGLKDICHSITGGALAAQGYWMPYIAARAVATTFCWPIRYALLPLFGPNFAQDCIHPKAEGFDYMVIDQRIIKQCSDEAEAAHREVASVYVPKVSYADSYRDFSPTPTGSEVSSRSATPHFTEPSYAVSGSDCRAGRRRQQRRFRNRKQWRHIDFVRERWLSGSPSNSNDRERRNGFSGVPHAAEPAYLPSPRSDVSYWNERDASHRGDGRTLHSLTRPFFPELLSPSKSLSSNCLVETATERSTSPVSESRFNNEDGFSDSSFGSCLSPKTKKATKCTHNLPSPRVYGTAGSSDDGHHQATMAASCLPSNVMKQKHAELGEDKGEATAEELKAAWMLWQLHKAETSPSGSGVGLGHELNISEQNHSLVLRSEKVDSRERVEDRESPQVPDNLACRKRRASV